MVRNVLRYSDIVHLYCIHVIPFYGSAVLILRLCYDYLFFLSYLRIDKIYDSDDLPLTQMVLQRNTEVNDEDENAEDEEDNENSAEISDEVTNEGTFCLSLISNPYVRLLCGKIPRLISYLSFQSLLYASVVLKKR